MKMLPDVTGNIIHDAMTAGLMREHGIHRVLTRAAGVDLDPRVESAPVPE